MNRKSILAVFAGLVFVIVVTTLVDVVLHLAGVYPPMDRPMNDSQAVMATAYRIVISIAGAWLTARLAPDRPMKHAMALGYVGTVLGLVGVIASWGKGMGPAWYPIALTVLAVPQCWLGGRIYESRSAKTEAAA
jgi:uncharacterized membrane protein